MNKIKRIYELERLIEINLNALKHSEKSHPLYRRYELRLDELKLEYQERTGEAYERPRR